jgi:AmpD protein
MHINDGWLDIAQPIPSPNCDDRPDAEVSLIVVHGISLPAGHFGTRHVVDLFCNQLELSAHADFCDLEGVNVSAHLMIRRDGLVLQFVPFHQRAWHAGVSSYGGRSGCNDFSIGIELEGTDDTPYRPAQYQQLATICQLLMHDYGIDARCIVGHCDIAPGRKTDPGEAFNWPVFRSLVMAGIEAGIKAGMKAGSTREQGI